MSHYVAVIPFLIIIVFSIWTKQVLVGLFLGLLTASYIVSPTPLGSIEQMTTYIIKNLANETNLMILGFLYVFSGIVSLIEITGGIKGFIDTTCKKIKTRKQALLMVWITIIGTFSAPDLRIVTVAPIVKALQKRVDISKKRLAFIIEVTGLPIIVLIPVATAFIGFMTSVIQTSLKSVDMTGDPFKLFIRSIPYNIYSLITIILAFIYTIFGHPRLFHKKEIVTPPVDDKSIWEDSSPVAAEELASRPLNLYIPLICALVLTIVLSWYDGYQRSHSFAKAFLEANVTRAMFVAIIITLIITFIMLLIEKYPLGMLLEGFFLGGNNLMQPFFIFILVWGLAEATNDLGLAEFVTAALGATPKSLVPPIVFLVGCFFAYFIGSSFGAWGLIMPIGFALAKASGVPLPVQIGVVFATGTFGGLVSPLSDSTITMAKIMDLDVMEYSRYKLKHTIVPLTLATIGYLILDFVR